MNCERGLERNQQNGHEPQGAEDIFLPVTKTLKSLRHGVEAVGFFAIMGFFRMLGVERASAAGGKFARFFGPMVPVTKRARTNLEMCFPEKTSSELQEIISDMWENLGRTFAEYAHLDKFSIDEGNDYIELEGFAHAEAVKEQGRGALFLAGHFGNWELLPLLLNKSMFAGAAIYRTANNPFVDRWLLKRRRAFINPSLIPKGAQGARQFISILKNKGYVGLLVDQKLNDGIPVAFFGRNAMTAPAPAQLSLRYDFPLIPTSFRRVKGCHFKMTIHPPLQFQPSGNRTDDIAKFTLIINQWLEDTIREAPGQWLWLHNRWPKQDAQSNFSMGDAA